MLDLRLSGKEQERGDGVKAMKPQHPFLLLKKETDRVTSDVTVRKVNSVQCVIRDKVIITLFQTECFLRVVGGWLILCRT